MNLKEQNFLKEEFVELCFCSSEGAFHMDTNDAKEIADWFINTIENIETLIEQQPKEDLEEYFWGK